MIATGVFSVLGDRTPRQTLQQAKPGQGFVEQGAMTAHHKNGAGDVLFGHRRLVAGHVS
jgi:hypothetical protein